MDLKMALQIFGLEDLVAKAELTKIHRSLSCKYHPDFNDGSEECLEKMKLINAAYDILMNVDVNKIKHDSSKPKSRFTADEMAKITRLCRKIGIMIQDAALSYETGKAHGFKGSFIEWLEKRANNLDMYRTNESRILQLAYRIGYFKNTSLDFIVSFYEQERKMDGKSINPEDIIYWLQNKIWYSERQKEIDKSIGELKQNYQQDVKNKYNKSFDFWLNEELRISNACRNLNINGDIIRFIFYHFKGKDGLKYDNLVEWFKREENIEEIYKDYCDRIMNVARRTSEFCGASIEMVIDSYMQEQHKESIIEWLKNKIDNNKVDSVENHTKTTISDDEIAKLYRESCMRGYRGTFDDWVNNEFKVIQLCNELGMDVAIAQLEFWVYTGKTGYTGSIVGWLEQKKICKIYNVDPEVISCDVCDHFNKIGKIDKLYDIMKKAKSGNAEKTYHK